MKIIHKYIIKEQIGPFVAGLAIVLMVFLLDFLLEILDLIFSKGAGLALVLKLFFYNLSWMLALAVPMATLLATIISFGRLSEDGEILAIRSTGISIYRLSSPLIFFYLALTAIMIYFSANILPESNYKAKTLMVSLSKKRPTISIKEGYFNEITDYHTIFTKKANYKENKLYGIILYDKSKGRYPEIVVADSGKIKYDEKSDALILYLYSGEIHSINQENPSQFTRALFRRQKIEIKDIGSKFELLKAVTRGDREMTISMLKGEINEREKRIEDNRKKIVELSHQGVLLISRRNRINDLKRDIKTIYLQTNILLQEIKALKKEKNAYLVEIEKKYAIPFACFLFPLLGIPIGILVRRGGYLTSIAISILFFVVYWAFLVGGEELADRGKINGTISIWSANFVTAYLAFYFNYRLNYERTPFRAIEWLKSHKFIRNLFKGRNNGYIYDFTGKGIKT